MWLTHLLDNLHCDHCNVTRPHGRTVSNERQRLARFSANLAARVPKFREHHDQARIQVLRNDASSKPAGTPRAYAVLQNVQACEHDLRNLVLYSSLDDVAELLDFGRCGEVR